jgi:hypothetical protein
MEREVDKLERTSWLVISYLVGVVLACLAVGSALLAGWSPGSERLQNILLCIVAGTMGSGVSAALSAADRISHGWELGKGTKLPKLEPKDKFVRRMVPFFMIRPFLGSAMGLLIYAGLTAGYLIAVVNPGKASFSDQGLFFLSFLGGLFAKTFIEKLRDTFDTLFGKSK